MNVVVDGTSYLGTGCVIVILAMVILLLIEVPRKVSLVLLVLLVLVIWGRYYVDVHWVHGPTS